MVQGQKMTNYGPNKMLDLNTSYERYLSKLSENHKMFERKNLPIWKYHGPRPKTDKLWPLQNVGFKHNLKGIFLSFQSFQKIRKCMAAN